jgi:hypothetical protein
VSERDADGRWQSPWRTWELPELVRQVALTVSPDNPPSLGARRYDRERANVGFDDAPTASAIRGRLHAPGWSELLQTIFSETADVFQEVWRWREGVVAARFTQQDAIQALTAVAALLGQRTMSPGEYAYARLELLARDPTHRTRLPSLRQLMYYGGGEQRSNRGWNDLLDRAGLAVLPSNTPPLTVAEALDACVSAHGTLPTKTELRCFVRANRLTMIDGTEARLGANERAELQRRRAARGLSTPDAPPPAAERPDYSVPVAIDRIPADLRRFSRRSRQHRHTQDSALSMMHAFLDQLPDELTPAAVIYDEFAARTEGAPGQGALVKLGSFRQIRDAALSERVTRRLQDLGVQSAAAHPYKGRWVTSNESSASKAASQEAAADEF